MMKLNEFTLIAGNSVILVPYEEFHVPKYHEWMKSEELQILTASEPLSIEDEYKMQKSWREDPDIKYHICCTFIVLNKETYNKTQNEVDSMIGDTNIFLRSDDGVLIGEIEIMIAEKEARGKGLGKEAVLLMLRYGVENLKINIFEAKIGMINEKSIALFESIGFTKVDENQIFKEVVLSKNVTEEWTDWMRSHTQCYCESIKKS